MKHSQLLTHILDRAEKIRQEKKLNYISPALIVAACSDYRAEEYTGLTDYLYPERYEEERLRYIYKRAFKMGSTLRPHYANKAVQRREELDIPFDFSVSEQIAQSRGKESLSADLVFLSALRMVPAQDRVCHPGYKEEFDIAEAMAAIDSHIYDFVIELNTGLRDRYQKRIDEAIALRDWRPALKFAAPEELAESFFRAVQTGFAGNILTMQLPFFFGNSGLTLSFHNVDGVFYVHDHGCTVAKLRKKVPDGKRAERIIAETCAKAFIHQDRITGSFTNVWQLLYYLQRLIFLANANLFYTRLSRKIYPASRSEHYIEPTMAEPFDPAGLLEKLKGALSFAYDENSGLFLNVSTTYSLFSTHISYLLETLDGDTIRISDRHKGNIEGEIFEAFYWAHDDIAPYAKFIEKFTRRFGACFDGKNVYLDGKTENWIQTLFAFINLAVLLSEVGHDISLPR